MARPRIVVTALLTCAMLHLAAGSASASHRVPPVPTFLGARAYEVGYTTTVVSADFNGDGVPDMAFPKFDSVGVALGNGDGTLGVVVDSPSGINPSGLVAADFNGDGVSDLAATHLYTNVLSILIGVGDGSFAAPVDYNVADDLISIAAGDLNGDGTPDIVVGNQIGPGSHRGPLDGHQAVLVLLNNGDGTFGASTQYSTSGAPSPVTAVDLNNDGFADVIAALGFGSDSLAVWLSDATGLLHGPKLYGMSDYPLGMTTGYLNHDGYVDVVTVNGDGNVNVLVNGPSGFAPEVSYPSAVTFPIAVAIGDVVEGDGPDLAVIGQQGALSVLPNAGDGTFGSATISSAGALAASLVTADLNGDSHLDVVTAAQGLGLAVLLGNGRGQFLAAPVVSLANAPVGIRVADFNGDGRPDLAVLDNYDENVDGDVSILLWTGPDAFALAGDLPAGRDPQDLAVADFNNDGAQDLAIADGPNDVRNLTIILGNGDGTFRAPGSVGLANAPTNILTGDFNGDGNADIGVGISNTFTQTAQLTVVLGNGDGTFQAPVTYAGSPGSPTGLVAADINKDGRLDVVLLAQDESVLEGGGLETFLGNGDGTFQPFRAARLGFRTGGLAIADLNGDRAPDLVMVEQQDQVAVSLGLGDGSFGPLTAYATGTGPDDVVLGDMDGDGILDLVVGHEVGGVGIFSGVGDGTFQPAVFYANGDSIAQDNNPLVALGRFHGGHALDIAVAESSQFQVAILKQLAPSAR